MNKEKSKKKQLCKPLSEEEQSFVDLINKNVADVVKLKIDGERLRYEGEITDHQRTLGKLAKLFGNTDYVPSVWLTNQLAGLDERAGESPDYVQQMLHMVSQLEPRDPAEGMLITQMVVTQKMMMDSAKRANLSAQTFEGRQANMNYCFKLMRAFANQMDTLNKHRGKGQQKMTVEHVHVNDGGQAVIGNVEGGGKTKK